MPACRLYNPPRGLLLPLIVREQWTAGSDAIHPMSSPAHALTMVRVPYESRLSSQNMAAPLSIAEHISATIANTSARNPTTMMTPGVSCLPSSLPLRSYRRCLTMSHTNHFIHSSTNAVFKDFHLSRARAVCSRLIISGAARYSHPANDRSFCEKNTNLRPISANYWRFTERRFWHYKAENTFSGKPIPRRTYPHGC